MKKVLAIVLALVMVCTLALAEVTYKSTKLGDEKITTLEGKFDVLKMEDNTSILEDTVNKVTLTTHQNDVKVTTDDKTITTYYADVYKVAGTDYCAVDADAADYKLVNKDKKVVAYLTTDTVVTDLAVDKVVKYAKDAKLTCGDYAVPATSGKVDADTTVYVIDDEAYLAGGSNWAVLNGKFVKYDTTVDVIEHGDLEVNAYVSTAPNADVASVKCPDCKKVINVVKKVPVASADAYTAITLSGTTYYYLTAATDVTATTTTTTNPDTGANDVIGVAAALAVVALVSGAAISLKK